jgi:hypothetical protein
MRPCCTGSTVCRAFNHPLAHQFHETAIGRCGRKLQSLKFGMRRPAPATGMVKCQIEVVSLAYR